MTTSPSSASASTPSAATRACRASRWRRSPPAPRSRDAGVGWDDVEFASGGSDAGGQRRHDGRRCSASPACRSSTSRNGCATGGSALATAHAMLAAGAAEIALVVGFDKHPPGAFNPLPEDWGLGYWYGETGLMLTTQFFAMKIQRYMHEHGISESTLAKVAAEGVRQRRAQPERLAPHAAVGGGDARLADGQPPADAVHVLLAGRGRGRARAGARRARAERSRARPVYLRSVAFRTRRFGSFEVFSPSLPIDDGAVADDRGGGGRVRAGRHRPRGRRRRPAPGHRVRRRDHAPRRDRPLRARRAGGADPERRDARSDGRLPVNTDGGCLANGEPIGASGLRQVHEVVLQLRGEAGERQVAGPRARRLHPRLRRARRQRLHGAQPLSAAREVQLVAYPRRRAASRATSASSRFRCASPRPRRGPGPQHVDVGRSRPEAAARARRAPAGYFAAFRLRAAMDGIMTVGEVVESRADGFAAGRHRLARARAGATTPSSRPERRRSAGSAR